MEIEGVEKKINLKPFGSVPSGVIRRNRKNPEQGMWEIIEWGAVSEADLAVFDELPLTEVEDLFTAWQEAGQVTVGNSRASRPHREAWHRTRIRPNQRRATPT